MQRLARRWQTQNVRVGFVPDDGLYLHEGHLSLVRLARQIVGPRGIVVVSIYVNPTQFGPHEDLSRYPRNFARDKKLCRAAGVDVIFAPADGEMYPQNAHGPYSTYVIEESLSRGLEGASRPTHFRGVATIVAKLFNLVQPEVAVFGAKDFQQAALIQRMVRDLNFPVKIIVAPTHREPDGLAMSSRNKYLNPLQRRQAVVLSQALRQAKVTVQQRKNFRRQIKDATHPTHRHPAIRSPPRLPRIFQSQNLGTSQTSRAGCPLGPRHFFRQNAID